MANQIEKYCMKNLLIVENLCSVKDEDFEKILDDKTNVSETAITIDNVDLIDYTQCTVSTIPDNIKEEISSEKEYTSIEEGVKIEEGICADDINIIFNNGLLYCENCHVYYEDYCCTCEMLLHILNKDASSNTDNETQHELPDAVLEIQYSFGQLGIFALKVIPAGVKFGPFTGFSKSECQWKIKGGKFVINETKRKYLNWMQYVNTTKTTSEQNLLVYQYEDNLYYRSTRRIEEGDELLLYFDEAYKNSRNNDGEMDLVPVTEHNFKDAFACMFCCLAFSKISYLAQHKTICINNADGGFFIEELTQCPFCSIHMDHKEYFEHHMAYCCKRNVRKCISTAPNHQAAEAIERKAPIRPTYKCKHCKYGTKYKRNLIVHVRKHREMKTNNSSRPDIRPRTNESRTLHTAQQFDSVHRSSRLKLFKKQLNLELDYKSYSNNFKTKRKYGLGKHTKTKLNSIDNKCASCNYKTNCEYRLKKHIKANQPKEFKKKRSSCAYRTNNKDCLENHTKTVHLKEFDFKCALCSFETKDKERLKEHVNAKHLKEYVCNFETNHKEHVDEHMKAKRLKEFEYKCDLCHFKTNRKHSLRNHRQNTHLKKMKCTSCEYTTKRKDFMEKHVTMLHLKDFFYKCDSCQFKSNRRDRLKGHIKSVHLKEFDYHCASCDFKTNRKDRLRKHIKVEHLKEFDSKCDFKTNKKNLLQCVRRKCDEGSVYTCYTCEFKTYSKEHLKNHIKGEHLTGFDYKCDICDFVTKRKYRLKSHIKTRHLNVFDYKCDSCDFKTNRRDHLKTHIKSKHLKQFDYKCDACAFGTNNKYDLGRHVECRHSKKEVITS